jgi:acyl dehydratase
MGMYFEDFEIGHVSRTRGRTVTEADVVNFAGVSGDFVELHVNEEFAKAGPFGRRIAHGLLVLSMSSGLMVQTGQTADTVIAFYGIDKLRFVRPTFLGDTIRVEKKVIDKQEKERGGVLTFETSVFNQNGEVVLAYIDKLMIKRRRAA